MLWTVAHVLYWWMFNNLTDYLPAGQAKKRFLFISFLLEFKFVSIELARAWQLYKMSQYVCNSQLVLSFFSLSFLFCGMEFAGRHWSSWRLKYHTECFLNPKYNVKRCNNDSYRCNVSLIHSHDSWIMITKLCIPTCYALCSMWYYWCDMVDSVD